MPKSQNFADTNGNSGNQKDFPGLRGGREELETYFQRHAVPEKGQAFVLEAFKDPVRRVGGGRGNVCVRYVSKKMGCVIQAESRTIELAFVEQCEHDPAVHFYLCQPGKLFVRHRDATERMRGQWYTPDFLVCDEKGLWLYECKAEAELERKAESPAPRFIRNGSGWRCPAAEEAAERLGLGFRVFSSKDINVTWIRNIRYFQDYVDQPCPDEGLAEAVVQRLSRVGSLRIYEVLEMTGMKPETPYWLVANGHVWADLEHELVFDPDRGWMHATESLMLANRHLLAAGEGSQRLFDVSPVRIRAGAALLWDGQRWSVVNNGDGVVTLQGDEKKGQIARLGLAEIDRLVADGAIRGVDCGAEDGVSRRREELFRRAGKRALVAANRRYMLLKEADRTGRVPEGSSARSIARYRQQYREGDRVYGYGFAGLIRIRGRKPGKRDLGEAQQQILDEFIWTFRKDLKAGRVTAGYARLVALCAERGVDPPPSRNTFRLAVKGLSRPALALGRLGGRTADELAGPVAGFGIWLPVEGDRVMEIAHVDSTQADLELVSRRTGLSLGRPWITLLIDSRSRLVLGWWISFDRPSWTALSGVLFDCAARHRRLPDNLVVDRGNEHFSNDFEVALGLLDINKLERPPMRPRFGATIERLFGNNNTRFVQELQGNTRHFRPGSRKVSRSHHPKRLAVWTLPQLHEFCERWLFEVYPNLVHETLGVTPRQAFEKGLADAGEREVRFLAADESLRILLAETPRKPTRRVDGSRGITIDHLRYWNDEFLAGDIAGADVDVKLDPLDAGIVYARVRGRWLTCQLADGDADLGGRSRKQVELAIQELKKQRQAGARGREVNARIIGEFLLEADRQGELGRQIERDAEMRGVASNGVPQADTGPLRLVKNDPSSSPAGTSSSEGESSSSTPLRAVSDTDDVLDGVVPYDLI